MSEQSDDKTCQCDSDEDADKTRFAVCVTCGRLKNTELFEEGDCTCKDCHSAGRSEVNYRLRNDGYFEEVDA